MTLQEHLASLGACDAARTWAGGLTSKEVWEKCERADWLLWWAARTDVNSLRQIVLAACACARRALRYIPEGENRPLLAIEAAECWAENPSAKNHDAARAAARAADAAATAADARAADARAYAAYAAARAADAARAAARAAADAAATAAADARAYAAYAAARAAARAADAAATAADARAAEHIEMCVAIRRILQQPWSE